MPFFFLISSCFTVLLLDVDSSRSGEPHLKEEIEKLLKERAVLLNETKKHNETLQEKTSLITQEYETVIEQKNERIEKVRAGLQLSKRRLSWFWGIFNNSDGFCGIPLDPNHPKYKPL